MRDLARLKAFAAALVLTPLIGAVKAADWDEYPVVTSVAEAEALPLDAPAVSVRAPAAELRAVCEVLAGRDRLHAVHLQFTGAASAIEPLKKMRRLYAISMRTNVRTAELFPIIGEFRDLRSFHLSMH